MKKATAEALRKKTHKKKEEQVERDIYNFNEGRLNADRYWTNAIDDRIAELEQQVGIPELRRLKKQTRYQWKNE